MADLYSKAKEMFPNATDEEINSSIEQIKQRVPQATDDQILKVASAIKDQGETGGFQKQMMQEDLRQRYGLDKKYSDEARQKIVDQNAAEADGGFNFRAFAAGLGQGIAGRDAASGAKMVLDQEAAQRKGRLDEFDKGRARALEDFELDRKFKAAEREDKKALEADELAALEKDPTSPQSKLAQELAGKLLPGRDFSQMNAKQINEMFPSLSKLYDVQLKQQELDYRKQKDASDREMKLHELGMKQAERAAKGKELKHNQAVAGAFGKRVAQAEQVFEELDKAGYNRGSIGSAIVSALPNVLQSEEAQRQAQAERNFINAVLRRESGAAIQPSEFESAEIQYFPRAGDSEEVVAQKKRNRQQALQSLKAEAGPAWEAIPLVGKENQFPMQVRKDGQVATVSNQEELEEAKAEGWK